MSINFSAAIMQAAADMKEGHKDLFAFFALRKIKEDKK